MDPSKRGCLSNGDLEMMSEGSGGLFRHYTQANCLLECSLRHASASCGGCVPAEYPHFRGGLPVCDAVRRRCFAAAAGEEQGEAADADGCHCPTGCDLLSYDYKIQARFITAGWRVCGSL